MDYDGYLEGNRQVLTDFINILGISAQESCVIDLKYLVNCLRI